MFWEDIRTRQYGLGEIFSKGFYIYKNNFKAIALITLFINLPQNFLTTIVGQNAPLRMNIWVNSLLELLMGSLAIISIAYLTEQSLLEQNISAKIALKQALSRWISAIFTEMIAGLAILGLLLLLIVPGVIWAVYFSFSIYVVALRGRESKDALDYSKWLVAGQWWRVLGIFIAITLAGSFCSHIWTVPVATWLELFFPSSPSFDIAMLVQIVSNTLLETGASLIYNLFTVMTVVFFLNTDYLKQKAFWENEGIHHAKTA